jgi:cell division protease FtsH
VRDDLQRATDLAGSMVAVYGMSESLGPVAFKGRTRQRFLEMPGVEPEPFAEETARQIDAEIKKLVVEAHTRASDFLRDRRSVLGTLARRLMVREVNEGAEKRALIERTSWSAPHAA